jgi:hypothetical protein
MAGTLTLSTLSDGTNSTSSTNPILGSAKAWVNFQGGSGNTAGTINGSFNVSSVTVNGTGDYTVNMTNAMANANYGAIAAGYWLTTQSSNYGFQTSVYNTSSSACRVSFIYTNGTYFNSFSTSVAVLSS